MVPEYLVKLQESFEVGANLGSFIFLVHMLSKEFF